MFKSVRGRLSGWLAVLAFWPVLGLGQEFLVHPEDATVCIGEEAVFTVRAIAEDDVSPIHWYINNIRYDLLSSKERGLIEISSSFFIGTARRDIATLSYNEIFNELTVQCRLSGSQIVHSNLAFLFYESNQQFPVTGLISTIDGTDAQLEWDEHNSNLTTQYLVGIYDYNNHLIANQTTNTTHINYDLSPRVNNACQHLEFRVTADQCPDPKNGFVQNKAATFVHREPDIDLSPVTAELDDNQAVLVSWTPDGDDTFWIVVTDLESGEQFQTAHGTPPYVHEKTCGKLHIAVSPAQCADNPAFTHSTNISIDCPTSGTQAIFPSMLLVIAAIIPLLKWLY